MSKSEIVIYKSSEGKTEIQVKLEGDSIWLSQWLMAELFEKDSRQSMEKQHFAQSYAK